MTSLARYAHKGVMNVIGVPVVIERRNVSHRIQYLNTQSPTGNTV